MTPTQTLDLLLFHVLGHVNDYNYELFLYSSGIAEETGLPVDIVRAVLAEARRRGLCNLTTSWNEDEGCPSGSINIRTAAGTRFLDTGHIS